MSRIFKSLVLCAVVAPGVSMFSGCTQSLESRTVNRFAEALAARDFKTVNAHASRQFAERALRRSEALDDVKILKLPEGETSVANIEDVSDTEKRVIVTVGENERRVLYRLVREGASEKWVVDDVFINQKQDGLTATRSVTEQMDLLLTIRDLLDVWDGGSRDDVLSMSTDRLAEVLEELPDDALRRLTKQVAGKRGKTSKFRPEAQLDGNTAVVQLPRSTGRLVLSMRLIDDLWLVDDAAVESRADGEHIASLLKRAAAVGATVSFLDAYNDGDKQKLAGTASKKLFDEVLEPARLADVPLPRVNQTEGDFELKIVEDRANVVLNGQREVVNITLVREDVTGRFGSRPKFTVEDVTIYETDGTQEIRLSAAFTAQAVTQVYAKALGRGDLTALRQLSTGDFNERAWKHIAPESFADMIPAEIEAARPKIESTRFNGPVTEITVMQGRRVLTYVLRDRDGRLRVDDVLLPVVNRPKSLKTTLELLLPVHQFAAAMAAGNKGELMNKSSAEFNRMVWEQTERMPRSGRPAPTHLGAPLTAVELTDDQEKALLTLGGEKFGARVLLVRGSRGFVVDEVLMIAGVLPGQRAKLKHTMKLELANGGMIPERNSVDDRAIAMPSVRSRSDALPSIHPRRNETAVSLDEGANGAIGPRIRHAFAETEPIRNRDNGVRHAGYEVPVDGRTLPEPRRFNSADAVRMLEPSDAAFTPPGGTVRHLGTADHDAPPW